MFLLGWKIKMLIQTSLKSIPKSSVGNKSDSGGRLNKKDGLTRYGVSHVKDKTS